MYNLTEIRLIFIIIIIIIYCLRDISLKISLNKESAVSIGHI